MNYTTITDTYNFECTLCANCCTGDTEILLDFYDLYKMGRFLNYSDSGELFKNGYVYLQKTENEIWRPRLRFKKKPFSFCPFLEHQMDDKGKISGLCKLHPKHKPLVCATAPIGRRYDFAMQTVEYIYHKPAPDCPGVHSQKVNHIGKLEEEYRQEFYYQKITFQILENLQLTNFTKDKMQKLYSFPLNEDFDFIIDRIRQSARITL